MNKHNLALLKVHGTAVLFGETPTLKMFIGGAIILLSVAWSNLKK